VSLLTRIRGLNAQISVLDQQIDQTIVEVSMLAHIDDDAQRDAVVSERYEDRVAAKMTRSDVIRIETHLASLERDRSKLVHKRDKLIRKLAAT
jgi:flagellar biosynthesis chaperone FliJ